MGGTIARARGSRRRRCGSSSSPTAARRSTRATPRSARARRTRHARGRRARRDRLRPPRPSRHAPRHAPARRGEPRRRGARSRLRARPSSTRLHPDVNRDHRVLFDSVAVATRPMPGQPVRRVSHLRADVEHRVDAALAQLVRPELVRGRHRNDRAQARGVRPLRDRATRVPASAQRARDPGGSGVLRRELRLRATPSRSCSCEASNGSNFRALARWPQLLIALALLGATAAAFAVTERLKLERSPVTGTRVDHVFSPVCECARDVAVISIVLRRRETVTLDILDRNGRSIRTIVRKRREPAGRVSYTWDGRDNLGLVVPEGVYRPRVQLERNGRTIVLPNPIRVDTTAPTIRLVRVFPRVFSPDADGRRDRVTATYRVDERANAVMLVDGRQRVQSKFRQARGEPRLVRPRERPRRRAGPVRDPVCVQSIGPGNRSPRTRAVAVRVRFVGLSRERIEVVAGKRFSVRVLTDATRLSLALRGTAGSRSTRGARSARA